MLPSLLLLLAGLDLNEITALPPLWQARALLHHIESEQLSGPEARDLARRAYTLATSVEPGFPVKDYPRAFARLGPPELTAAEAAVVFNIHRGDQTPLPFPPRLRSTPATCAHTELDHAAPYLAQALQAGPEPYREALLTLRSPLEIEEGLESLKPSGDARAAALLIRRLRSFQDSRREADAALHLGSLVSFWADKVGDPDSLNADYAHYQSRLESLPPCSDSPPQPAYTFSNLKQQLLSTSATSDYEFTELLLHALTLATSDPTILTDLESSGNTRLRILTQALRPAQPRR